MRDPNEEDKVEVEEVDDLGADPHMRAVHPGVLQL